METKGRMIVVIVGPSGVGKSTVIKHLTKLEPRLRQVSVYTIREPRGAEDDKRHVSAEQLEALEQVGSVKIFKHYGASYGEPIADVINIQNQGNTPIMDINVVYVEEWLSYVGCESFVVYLLPESLAELRSRLAKDSRDPTGERFKSACDEMTAMKAGRYRDIINVSRINYNSEATARQLAPILRRKIDEIAPVTSPSSS